MDVMSWFHKILPMDVLTFLAEVQNDHLIHRPSIYEESDIHLVFCVIDTFLL